MAKNERILVIEDDERTRSALVELLQSWGYDTQAAADGITGWEKIVSSSPAVVLSDLKMAGRDGLELLKQTRDFNLSIDFLMLTGHGTIQNTVEATRLGAYDFLEKPVDSHRLQVLLKNCLDRRESERQLQIAHQKQCNLGKLGRLVGGSRTMRKVMSAVTLAAPSSASVLITGESGTGKEVVAQTIHDLSPRRGNAFVAVNCAAIPESLMESELFGHEKGAFTGANQSSKGCVELAHDGTLLLDEIGEMSVAAQAKLLRVLEDSKVRRLGGQSEIEVSVRVLASTNREPEEVVKNGRLRRDLFYRLNVFHIAMPPLRERLEDLEVLFETLLEDLCQKHKCALKTVDPETLQLMRRYTWPGNVRELRNVLERAVVTCPDEAIRPTDLPSEVRGERENGLADPSRIEVGLSLEEAERRLILNTLSSTNNNKSRAASILGISLKTLLSKLKEYGSAPTALN